MWGAELAEELLVRSNLVPGHCQPRRGPHRERSALRSRRSASAKLGIFGSMK